MDIKSIVSTTAQVIRITQLSKGNVVKYVKENTYGSPEIKYAVVTDILNGGDAAFIELTTYCKTYGEPKVDIELLSSSSASKDNIHLFPAEPEQLKTFFDGIISDARKDIADKTEALHKKAEALNRLESFSQNPELLSIPASESL